MVKCIDVFFCIFVGMFVYFGPPQSFNSFGNNEKILILVKNVFESDVIGIKVNQKFANDDNSINDNTPLINNSTYLNELKRLGINGVGFFVSSP
eukprot:UN06387